jgi:D-alanine-D-alanine ligase
MRERFPDQDILIENFLEGRDFTVLVMGTRDRARVIGVLEQVWRRNITEGKSKVPAFEDIWELKGDKLVPGLGPQGGKGDIQSNGNAEFTAEVFGYEAKRDQTVDALPSILLVKGDLNDPVIQKVAEVALQAHRALDCFDCSRTDVRHDTWGENAKPHFIEVRKVSPSREIEID